MDYLMIAKAGPIILGIAGILLAGLIYVFVKNVTTHLKDRVIQIQMFGISAKKLTENLFVKSVSKKRRNK